MADRTKPGAVLWFHPLQGVLLASTVPLSLGALLSDIAYGSSYQIQWSNFAAWLLVGAMVFIGVSLVWSLIAFLRAGRRVRWPLITLVLLLAAFVVGLIDCFVHARDAWGMMPTGLILSAILTLLVTAATWVGFSNIGAGAVR